MVDVNRIKMMRYVIVFIIIYLGLGLVMINSQETPSTAWEVITTSNADELTSAFAFQLETPADLSNSSVYMDSLAIIPNTNYVFVSYKDRDTRQRFTPIWQIWDIETQQLIISESSLAGVVSFSSDGAFFALQEIYEDNNLQLCLWDVANFARLNCWTSGTFLVNPFNVTNDLFVFSRSQNGQFELVGWDIVNNQELFIINDAGRWAFNPQRHHEMVIANSDEISLWNVESIPQKLNFYKFTGEILTSNMTFNSTGDFIFFTIFSFTDSKEKIVSLNLSSLDITTIEDYIVDLGIFQSLYINIMPIRREDSSTLRWIDPVTHENLFSSENPILDTNLSQDLALTVSEDDTFTVQNLLTAEIYATLPYVVDGMRYQDVRFTQDERFIIAYTEDGLVQLWGVPAEG